MIFAIFVAWLASPSTDMARYVSNDRAPIEGLGTSPVTVTFLGTSTLLFEDGTTALLVDGFFTRPSKLRVAAGFVKTEPVEVQQVLDRLGVAKLHAILLVHSHYDHALDSAYVARCTEAILVGSESTLKIGRAGGLRDGRLRQYNVGEPVRFDAFTVTPLESRHSPPMPGLDDLGEQVTEKFKIPARASAYKEGGSYDLLIKHGRVRFLVKASAGYGEDLLHDVRADVLFLGTGTLGIQSPEYRDAYYRNTAERVEPKLIVPVHWDDFTTPLSDRLPAMPWLMDDTGTSLDFVVERAGAERIPVKVLQGFQTLSMDGRVFTRQQVIGGKRATCE